MKSEKRKMKRINLLHRSIDTAYRHLNDVLYSKDEDEVFIALKTLLDLIFSADEMYFERAGYFNRRDNDDKGNLLNGLRYAANLLKHEKVCFEVHQINTKPMFSFPLVIPEEGIVMGEIQAEWIKVDTLPNPKLDNNTNFIKQKNVYNEYLVGNKLFKALDSGIEFLLKEKDNIIV